jgi:hypothetical protein
MRNHGDMFASVGRIRHSTVVASAWKGTVQEESTPKRHKRRSDTCHPPFQVRGPPLETQQETATQEVSSVQVQETTAEGAEAAGRWSHYTGRGRHHAPPVQGYKRKQRRR